jgi:tetratricopeptide (TPR) repeat protein
VSRSLSVGLAVVLIASCALIYVIRSGMDYRRYSAEVVEELTYYPSGRLLKVADLGFTSLVADVMWLRGIQYYGEHRSGDRRYPLAEHIFSSITNLDPEFIGAYRFGAIVVCEDAGSPAGAISLLRKGLASNPGCWEIPFDLGFLYFIDLNDYARAAHYFKFASGMKGSPDLTRRFTAFAYRKAGKSDLAEALWEEIYRSSDNRLMKETAVYSINKIQMDKTVQALADAVCRFRSARGKSPESLTELVAGGFVASVPRDPFGGAYFLDPTSGVVSSTTEAAEEGMEAGRIVSRAVRRFLSQKGQLPASLAELKAQGFIAEIPDIAGSEVTYDPATGSVRYDLVPPRMGQ